MRIPAVMAIRNVLSRLKEGQRVKVDGAQGKVFLMEN
jgi:phosphohistidine swiveling domain-containing protein